VRLPQFRRHDQVARVGLGNARGRHASGEVVGHTGLRGVAAEAQERGYRFPYLFDATQEVAKAYTAACTPDFFVFGPDRTLVYRGRLDESRPGTSVPVTGAELRAAIEAVRNDRPVAEEQYPSMGCNIKWRPGNEPAYFQ
jgi:hypothetical protein